ncbi:hypothetical protein [uncultured Fructobacillus sp.]|uniref:hypothetical protein n=1 Tax=uncultured Fructobacillus sp. TaxID=591942 RepID=UPI00259303A2|nr:hypothetical protein [uncultured Fructobacillus sp.]
MNKMHEITNKALLQTTSKLAKIESNNSKLISNLSIDQKIPDFAKSYAGVATVGNTATYMVVFLLPDTR